MRRWILGATLAVAVGALAAGCGGGGSDNAGGDTGGTATDGGATASGALAGSVGPGFEISVDTSSASPGTYTLTVDDQSSSHNFHLTGTGVDVQTDVGATGTEAFTITLQAGEYRFQCDPHASSMNGTLTVG